MSTHHHAHLHLARRSPPNVNKVAIKTLRTAPPSKASLTPNITIKPVKGTKHPKNQDEGLPQDDDDEEDDMASSFLQFW